MTETFDTFTNRTTAYHVFAAICVLVFLFMVIGRISDLHIARAYVLCLVFAEVISFLTVAFLTTTGKSYHKDGELTLTSDAITIRSVVIPTSEIINLGIKTFSYKGKAAKFPQDGGDNSMELQTRDAIYSCRFVVKSKAQSDNLQQIINAWQANGVPMYTRLV